MSKRPTNRQLLESILENQEHIMATLTDLANAEGALTTEVAALVTATQAVDAALAAAQAAGATIPQNLVDAITAATASIATEVSAEDAAVTPPAPGH